MTKEALEAWAMRRCEIHLPQALQRAHDEWLSDERRSGDWSEVDPERCLAMVKSGMKFHLAQVERCYAEGGVSFLDRWRRGDRADWPAPDGFPLLPLTEAIHLQKKVLFLDGSLGSGKALVC